MSITKKKTRKISQRTAKLVTAKTFDAEKVRQALLYDAKIIGIPDGAAETIADKVTEKIRIWVIARPAITNDDLNRKIAVEAKRYSADLAYVYQNRGKII